MWLLYFLLHLLVLVGELLAVQDPWPVACRSQKYWVKPTDSDKCECTSASDSVNTTNDVDAKYRCATINQYAECLSNGTCKRNNVTFMLMKEKCIILIFLPGTHSLTNNLYISKRVSLTMIKEPECSGNVEIHLQNEANIILSYIAQLTLCDLSIINDNRNSQNNLTLTNVPHTCAQHSILKPPSIVDINNVSLSGSALIYECTRCKGKVNISNTRFNNSYASITTIDCPNLSMYIYSLHLFLNASQTGLMFDSLQLKSVFIDSLQTQGTMNNNIIGVTTPRPVYDLLFQSRSVGDLDIAIQNCRLERNQSAGLLIDAIIAHNHQFNFGISNSIISNHKHGGIMIHQPSVSTGTMNFTVEGSHIRYNRISMLKYYHHSHYAAGLSVHSETFNTTIVTIKHTEFKGNTDSQIWPVVVYIARAFHVLVENCNFTDNKGTAIQLNNVNDNCVSESFNFKGIVNFIGNSGYRGGALSLISSMISIQPNTTLIFENNEATDVGGAIFVDTNIPYNDATDPDTLVSCFYRFPMWNKDSESYSITFSNNAAINGGNDIYGASLNCYCTVFTDHGVNEVVRSVDQSVVALFNISKNDYRSSVSSTPHRVCLTNSDESVVSACSNLTRIFNHDLTVYPGQEFSLEAVLVGYEFGVGTGTINAQLMNNSGAQIWPESSKFQTMEEPKKTNLSYTLYTNDTKDTILVLTAENRNEIDQNVEESEVSLREAINDFYSSGIISSDLLTTPVYINVTFKLECPPGFELRQPPKINTGCDTCKDTQSTYNGCRCLKDFDSVMDCLFDSDHEDGYLCLKKPVWIELNDSEMFISNECPLDYCKADLSNIITADPNNNSLCDNYREGKLCGQCKEGYSLMLGSNKCGICSNDYIGLLAVFAVAGILLVILLIVLNVTVAQGTLNGLIFYANIVWAYNEIFFPKHNDDNCFNFLKMFIAWLNLDFGIEVCFFNGLNAYWKTWLQFAFPVYIWIIAGVIILLGRSRYLDRLIPSNTVKVLATLVLLSYSKLLRTVMIVLVPATIEIYSNGEKNSTDTVWRFDGEIEYGKLPEHCILLSVAILAIVFLWLPYTFILLFINYTRRWSVIARRKTFFDSYTGPLTPNCQFWVGLLLVVRCVLLVSLIYLHPDASVLSMVVIIILIFVLLYNTGSIYNDTTDISRYRFCRCVPKFVQQLSFLSMLDISFLLNLVFLGVAVLYADFKEGNKDDITTKTAVTYTSVGIVMLQFIGIIIYPRFQQYILQRFIVDPEPEPDLETANDQHRQVGHSSIEGIPLLDDEDT